MSLTIAIVGRANVGKSTLFNKLVGRRLALVHDTPGVTRDRREADGAIGALSFKVIDTAGIETGDSKESLEARMAAQTLAAVADADVCVLMIDARGIDYREGQRTERAFRFAPVAGDAGRVVHQRQPAADQLVE